MMTKYRSNTPTREKRNLFNYLERRNREDKLLHYIPSHEIEDYSKRKGFKIKRGRNNIHYIKNKQILNKLSNLPYRDFWDFMPNEIPPFMIVILPLIYLFALFKYLIYIIYGGLRKWQMNLLN